MAVETDRIWVDRLYRTMFNRAPTAAEANHWVGVIANGATDRAGVMQRLIDSPGFKGSLSRDDLIRKVYRTFLGREASAQEVRNWAGHHVYEAGPGGLRISDIAWQVSQSTEGRRRYTSTWNPMPTPGDGGDPVAPVPIGPTPGMQSARAQIDQILDRYGLGELKDWAWGRIQDAASPDQVLNELYDPSTEAGQVFDQHYPEFELLRQRRAGGEQVMIPSVDELLAVRNQYRTIMSQAGLPPGFYDEPSDFTQLIVNQRSPQELAQIINEGWRRVTEAPVEVRQAFADLFGVDGDAALAAEFLDPDRATPALIEMARTAEVEGTARRFGAGLGLERASRVASLQLSQAEVEQGFSQLDNLAGLFQETISETDDLTLEQHGVDAAFNLTAGARDILERRRATRVNLLSGGGAVAETRTGLGVGAAE